MVVIPAFTFSEAKEGGDFSIFASGNLVGREFGRAGDTGAIFRGIGVEDAGKTCLFSVCDVVTGDRNEPVKTFNVNN